MTVLVLVLCLTGCGGGDANLSELQKQQKGRKGEYNGKKQNDW